MKEDKNMLKMIENKLKLTLSNEKFLHSINVMNTSKSLAKYYNYDIEKAEIAGLLHDCGRIRQNINMDFKKNLTFHENENLNHAIIGAYLVVEEYNINDMDIINAVRYHTTGRENMSKLEKIIYIADKIEPTRKFDGVEQLRLLAYQNIDLAILKSLNDTIKYVIDKNQLLHEETIKARNFLLKNKEVI